MAVKKINITELKSVLKRMISEELGARYGDSLGKHSFSKVKEFLNDNRFQEISGRCGWVFEPTSLIWDSDGNWMEVFTQPEHEAKRIAEFGTYISALAERMAGDYIIMMGKRGDVSSKSGICSFKFQKIGEGTASK